MTPSSTGSLPTWFLQLSSWGVDLVEKGPTTINTKYRPSADDGQVNPSSGSPRPPGLLPVHPPGKSNYLEESPPGKCFCRHCGPHFLSSHVCWRLGKKLLTTQVFGTVKWFNITDHYNFINGNDVKRRCMTTYFAAVPSEPWHHPMWLSEQNEWSLTCSPATQMWALWEPGLSCFSLCIPSALLA